MILLKKQENGFEKPRDHVECELCSAMRGLEKDWEGANEGRKDDIPTIDLFSRVFEETEHIAESGHVEGPEKRGTKDYTQGGL